MLKVKVFSVANLNRMAPVSACYSIFTMFQDADITSN